MRPLLLAATFLAVAATAQAQAPTVGVKGGLNVASASFEFADFVLDFAGVDKVQQLGFVGGLTVDVPLSAALGLRAEVLYAQRGYGLDVEPNDRGISLSGPESVGVDYLEVPILLTRPFLASESVQIGTHVGIVPALKLNESYTCTDGDLDPENGCAPAGDLATGESILEAFDLGVAGGISVGSGPFSIEGRYTYGLTEFNVSDEDDGFFGGDAHHSVFSITAAYRFGRQPPRR